MPITRANLRARVRERVIPTFWSDTELNLYIVEALRVWNALTGYWRKRATVAFGTSSTDYVSTVTIATDTFAVLRVQGLDPMDVKDLGQFNQTWQEDTATTPSAWIPLGLNKIALYPRITTTFNGWVDYVQSATIPANDAATIDLADEDIPAIIDYIHFVCTIKEGGQELNAGMVMFQNFLKQASKYNAKLNTLGSFRKAMGIPAGGQEDTRKTHLEEIGR